MPNSVKPACFVLTLVDNVGNRVRRHGDGALLTP